MNHDENEGINFFQAVNIELPIEIEEFINEWKNKPGNLIAILHKVQGHYGFIPRSVAMKVSQMINQPLSKIYGVITFYHFFKLKKPGKHKIQVCAGTACYLAGSYDLLEELEKMLHVSVNNMTSDGLFSLEIVRCVGCCGLAPVMVIDGETFGNLEKERIPEIISKYSMI